MAWSKPKKIPEWKVQTRRDRCCSQGFKLRSAGNSDPDKWPTHYCPGCGYAFWLRTIEPTAEQISEYKKHVDPKATSATMSYRQYKITPKNAWGATPKTRMIDQLGGPGQPHWLHEPEKKYWRNLYCDKYPNSELGKARTQRRLEAKEKMTG